MEQQPEDEQNERNDQKHVNHFPWSTSFACHLAVSVLPSPPNLRLYFITPTFGRTVLKPEGSQAGYGSLLLSREQN